jgi:hypothetical protein
MCNESNCKHDPLGFADLDDFDNVETTAPATVAESIEEWAEHGNQSAQGAIYEEKCEACRGTGKFVSWAGRVVGPCFKCDGTGTRKFRTSPEQREKNRERAAAKREAKAKAKAEERNAKSVKWIEDNKEMFEFLQANAWSEFYKNMILAVAKYGSLTEKQHAAVERGMAKAAAKEKAKAESTGEALDISSLSGYYAVPNGETRLKVRVRKATNGRWAGWIFVDDGAAYGSRQNYGRQAPGGTYTGDIVDALKAILADPYEAMVAYGKLTGTCGACGRLLEDEASIEAGIGPICAKKF